MSAGPRSPVAAARSQTAGPRSPLAGAGSRAAGSRAKRLTDIVVAAFLLVVTSPILLVVAVAVAVRMGRPVLFRQKRTGYAGRPVELVKFRTMVSPVGPAAGLPDSARLTGLGRFLRRSSLDELPSLVGVLRGELSLVGPRPLLPRYDRWYSGPELLRFTVRPGLTGPAQVRGRNLARWDDRLALDAAYALDWSYGLDLRLLARTAWVVLARTDAVADPTAVMADLDVERAGPR